MGDFFFVDPYRQKLSPNTFYLNKFQMIAVECVSYLVESAVDMDKDKFAGRHEDFLDCSAYIVKTTGDLVPRDPPSRVGGQTTFSQSKKRRVRHNKRVVLSGKRQIQISQICSLNYDAIL